MRRAAASIANMSFALRCTHQSGHCDDKLGAQIFDRRRDPKHSEDENGEVISPHHQDHAGTHRSHVRHRGLPPASAIQWEWRSVGIARDEASMSVYSGTWVALEKAMRLS